MPLRTLLLFLAAAALAALTPALALAGPATAGTPLFAGYWGDFLDHWAGVFQKQNGIVVGALLVGALCLFIITRGKWRK